VSTPPIPGTDVRFTVAPPAAQPRPFGLPSQAAEGAPPPAGTFERGVEYWSPNCNLETGSLDGFCPVEGSDKEFTPFRPVRVTGAPRTVHSGTVCTQPGFDSRQEALAQLSRGDQYRLEQVFWRDQLAREDLHTVPTPPDGDTQLACALGLLESWAAGHYAGRPVLHVPVRLVPEMTRQHMLVRTATGLETTWGTPVVAGAGYSDPAVDPVPTTTPVLITGQVTLWRSNPFANSDVDHATNEHLGIAERTFVATADCLAAVVNLPTCAPTPPPGG